MGVSKALDSLYFMQNTLRIEFEKLHTKKSKKKQKSYKGKSISTP